MAYVPRFTDATKVKREAGFQNNLDIDDTLDVDPNIEKAEGEIIASVGQIYNLPLDDNPFWDDSPAEALIDNCATKLAAGLLLQQQFEGMGGDIDETGIRKMAKRRFNAFGRNCPHR